MGSGNRSRSSFAPARRRSSNGQSAQLYDKPSKIGTVGTEIELEHFEAWTASSPAYTRRQILRKQNKLCVALHHKPIVERLRFIILQGLCCPGRRRRARPTIGVLASAPEG